MGWASKNESQPIVVVYVLIYKQAYIGMAAQN